MYHRMGKRKLGRTSSHRLALLRNQAISFFSHGRIVTTLPKCKELRSFVERLISLCREDTLAHRRRMNRHIPNKELVHYLFEEIGPRYATRPGGYTRIVRLPDRTRDAAPVGRLEFVED